MDGSQPFSIRFKVGGKWLRHVPDVLVFRRAHRVLDSEPGGLDIDQLDLPVSYELTRWACEQLGWTYTVRRDLNRQLFENIRAAAECAKLLLGVRAYARLLCQAAHDQSRPPSWHAWRRPGSLFYPVLWHLLWHGRLTCHWERPIESSRA